MAFEDHVDGVIWETFLSQKELSNLKILKMTSPFDLTNWLTLQTSASVCVCVCVCEERERSDFKSESYCSLLCA
jgi:hypothetical protein